ncbi:phosphatase PAP2 family protein, partial [Streptomyces sp. NPDC056399]|uniref:phosphatase PAP2 family protein n=1 Tax=Streptomyces sp. NPDC056399 TaxID=3345807 RepID=UPI0035DEB2E6
PRHPGAPGTSPGAPTARAWAAYCGAASRVTTRRAPSAPVLTAATGTGLVLRGYHWPLDVLASLCLSLLILAVSSSCTRRSCSRTATG